MALRFKKDQIVRVALHGCGVTSYEKRKVLYMRKGKVWLDNGPGNDPIGPFDSTDGRYLGATVPGFSQYILSPK